MSRLVFCMVVDLLHATVRTQRRIAVALALCFIYPSAVGQVPALPRRRRRKTGQVGNLPHRLSMSAASSVEFPGILIDGRLHDYQISAGLPPNFDTLLLCPL